MTTRYVIRHHYSIDGISRAVVEQSFHDEDEAREAFADVSAARPGRCYDLAREIVEVLERSAAEPRALRMSTYPDELVYWPPDLAGPDSSTRRPDIKS